jgi:hypothetical protein
MAMRRSVLLLSIVLVASCATVLLVAAAAPSGSRQWEYAVYLEYPGNYEWQTATQRIRGTTPDSFFERMGLPAGVEVDPRAGNLRTRVFNYLGLQGWELTHVVKDSGQEAYWFKRPK